jgi:hypothetical protein
MAEEQDSSFTFSDEDFERRYSSDELPSSSASRAPRQTTKPLVAQLARSRNRYMRTLLRRRLATSARS